MRVGFHEKGRTEPKNEEDTTTTTTTTRPGSTMFSSARLLIDEGRSVDLALVADAGAMHAAVTAALGDVLLDGDTWWLVDGDGDYVPLSVDLPDKCSLGLRTTSGHVKRGDLRQLATQTPEWKNKTWRRSRDTHSIRGGFFGSCNAMSAKAQREPHRAHHLVELARRAKMTNHYGNKRTLLAWCRTSLTAERCVLLFFNFDDLNGPGLAQHLYFVAILLLCLWCLYAGLVGVQRYEKIKSVINSHLPSSSYYRGTLQPGIIVLGIVCSYLAVSVWARFIIGAGKEPKWHKEGLNHQQPFWG